MGLARNGAGTFDVALGVDFPAEPTPAEPTPHHQRFPRITHKE